MQQRHYLLKILSSTVFTLLLHCNNIYNIYNILTDKILQEQFMKIFLGLLTFSIVEVQNLLFFVCGCQNMSFFPRAFYLPLIFLSSFPGGYGISNIFCIIGIQCNNMHQGVIRNRGKNNDTNRFSSYFHTLPLKLMLKSLL